MTLTHADYRDLIDARDHAIAMRAVATGSIETLDEAELDAFLAAPSPLAYWRRRRGLTQAALAREACLTQPHIAQAERGKRGLSVAVYARLARVLAVRIEDLIPIQEN